MGFIQYCDFWRGFPPIIFFLGAGESRIACGLHPVEEKLNRKSP
jgi:hypothetical protein